jgi:site-specific recombinase XerC
MAERAKERAIKSQVEQKLAQEESGLWQFYLDRRKAAKESVHYNEKPLVTHNRQTSAKLINRYFSNVLNNCERSCSRDKAKASASDLEAFQTETQARSLRQSQIGAVGSSLNSSMVQVKPQTIQCSPAFKLHRPLNQRSIPVNVRHKASTSMLNSPPSLFDASRD